MLLRVFYVAECAKFLEGAPFNESPMRLPFEAACSVGVGVTLLELIFLLFIIAVYTPIPSGIYEDDYANTVFYVR